MQGILLVDKPAGWTSFDAVNYIRRQVALAEGKKPKSIKVGHTGTLDPFATGLLIILVGKDYTRRAGEFSKLDKTYEVTMRLGATSSTGDPEGELTVLEPDHRPSIDEIKTAVQKFTGPIMQTPPIFSAIKVNGQRAYKLARAGQQVVMESRQIIVNRLELLNYDYPEAKLVADVSSGTYIRSLVEDLGQTVATGAYTPQLRRTKIGAHSISTAQKISALSESNITLFLNEL